MPKRCTSDNDPIVVMTPHNVTSLPAACSRTSILRVSITVTFLANFYDGRPYCPSCKTNPNRNPNIAGPARVRWRLGTCHDGRMGHNLAKIGTFPLNGPIMMENEAHRAIFCTNKKPGCYGWPTILAQSWNCHTFGKWSGMRPSLTENINL